MAVQQDAAPSVIGQTGKGLRRSLFGDRGNGSAPCRLAIAASSNTPPAPPDHGCVATECAPSGPRPHRSNQNRSSRSVAPTGRRSQRSFFQTVSPETPLPPVLTPQFGRPLRGARPWPSSLASGPHGSGQTAKYDELARVVEKHCRRLNEYELLPRAISIMPFVDGIELVPKTKAA